MSDIKPIFVMGTARSGTTWLANLLASHPLIAAVAADEHHGVVESHLLDHTRFALPGVISVRSFLDRYQGEDYFRVMDLSPHECERQIRDPADAIALFTSIMDMY